MADVAIQHGLLYGCQVTASGTAMKSAVAAGTVLNANISASVSAQDVTHTASDTAQDRYDLVTSDSAGNLTVTAGALGSLSDGTAFQPDSPDNKLAYVPIPANCTNPSSAQDIRTFVHQDITSYQISSDWYSVLSNRSVNFAWTNNELHLCPFYSSRNFSFTNLGANCATSGTSGSKLRVGAYQDNGYGVLTLMVDGGQLPMDVSATSSTAASATGTPGFVWVGGAWQSLGATKPGVVAVEGPIYNSPVGVSDFSWAPVGALRYTGVSGALPSSLDVRNADTTFQQPPIVYMKAA